MFPCTKILLSVFTKTLTLLLWIFFSVTQSKKLLLSSQPAAGWWKFLNSKGESLLHSCLGSWSPKLLIFSGSHRQHHLPSHWKENLNSWASNTLWKLSTHMTHCVVNNSSKTQVKIHFNFAVFIYYINFTCYIFTVGQVLFIFKKTKIKL